MNEILQRMASDVQGLNGNTSARRDNFSVFSHSKFSHRTCSITLLKEVQGLKEFLREQQQKQYNKLTKYSNDNEQLKQENRKMRNTLKQKDKKSKDEINNLKSKLRKLERDARSSSQKKDKLRFLKIFEYINTKISGLLAFDCLLQLKNQILGNRKCD